MALTIDLTAEVDGPFTIEDDGIPGNGTSVVRRPNGTIFLTVVHPADSITVISRPGQSLNVNIADSLNAASFTIGSLTSSAMSPDSISFNNIQTTGTVTLVANGSILEAGSDVASDITAGALILSAGTGIGLPSNPIETRTGLFEAETTTGGVAINNIGAVQIGGISANVDGLDVATSGDILFNNVGSIFLTEANSVTAAEVVHGGGTSGNIVMTANGANSDVIANVNNGAFTAPRGSIQVTAGRDIQLGTIGSDFNNDVVSNNGVNFTAGRDILIDGFADVFSDNFGLDTGASLIFTAGRNIGILAAAGTSASVVASGGGGGDAIMTTGVNGSLTVNGPGSFDLGSTSGDVVIRADRILIDDGSGISAPNGTITISPSTNGRDMILGSATDAAFAVELSDVEINRIFTNSLLTIGSDQAGQIRVIAAINSIAAGTAPDLFLRGARILVEANLTTVDQLTLSGLDDVFQTGASVITAGGALTVNIDSTDTDPGFGETGTLVGMIAAASAIVNGGPDGDALNGSGFGETLSGAGGNDTLRGNGGNDLLNGGPGADTMLGGLGDDFFFVDSAADVATEAVGEGTGDRVFASVSYALAAGTAIDILSTVDNLATTAINLTGNALTQTIFGNAGANSLDGGGGGDTMLGFGGDDFYFVRNASDRAVEGAGDGTADRVFAAVSFTLEAGSQVEILSTIDNLATTAINLTGNALAQTIFGNAGANTLDSGGGGDTMLGFGGDDNYFVRTVTDRAVEAGGAGSDRVFASVSYALEAGSSIEMMTPFDFASTFAIDFQGNALSQAIFGNAGNNSLDGGGGGDTLVGLGGDDFFYIRSAADRAVETAGNGNDRVFALVSFALEAGSHVEMLTTIDNLATTAINLTGNELANSIFGNAGANSLDSGGGGDTMVGLGGDDFYFIRSSSDRAVEASGAGNDRVFAAVSFTLEAASHVEMLTTIDNLATTAINLVGNELANILFGNAGSNTLDGGGGNDTLIGLDGADTFQFSTTLGAGNVDSLSGFVVGQDKIAIDDAVFTGLALGALPAGAFRTGTMAQDADDRIIYDPASGAVYFDSDGIGGTAAVHFATLSAGLGLGAGDFVVI